MSLNSVNTDQGYDQIESQVRAILSNYTSLKPFWTVEIDIGIQLSQFDTFDDLYQYHFGDVEETIMPSGDDPQDADSYIQDSYTVIGATLHESCARQWSIYPNKNIIDQCLNRLRQSQQ